LEIAKRKPAEAGSSGWYDEQMKLPEYRPMPPQWNNDHDTKDAGASLWLLGSVALIAVGIVLFLLGVFA
jgi:hypothetical protein